MIGRFVEDEEVGLEQHESSELEAIAFAAGEFSDGFVNFLVFEKETGEDSEHLFVISVGDGEQFVENGVVAVEDFLLLVAIADGEAGSDADDGVFPTAQFDNVAEQGGFSAAVGSDQCPAFAAADLQFDIFEQFEFVESFAVVFDLQSDVGAGGIGLEIGGDFVTLGGGFFYGVSFFARELGSAGPESFAPRLAAGVALGDVGEFLDQGFQVGDPLLIGFVLGVLGFYPFGADLAIGGVVAGVVIGLAVVQFQDAVGDAVEQVTIMRNNQHSTAKAPQEIVQPGQAQVVQMVARFVEHEQVGIADKGVGHAEDVLFAAGKLADHLILSAGETEGIEQGLSTRFKMIAAAAVVEVACELVLMQQLIHLGGVAVCNGGFFIVEVGF